MYRVTQTVLQLTLSSEYVLFHFTTRILFFYSISLCRPNSNKIKGLPFRAVKAIPVDLFPHTRHCELVVVYKRVQSTSAIGSSKTVNEIENEGDSTDKVIQ